MLAEHSKTSDFQFVLNGKTISVRTGIRIAITECPAAKLNIKLHGPNTVLVCFPVASYLLHSKN